MCVVKKGLSRPLYLKNEVKNDKNTFLNGKRDWQSTGRPKVHARSTIIFSTKKQQKNVS